MDNSKRLFKIASELMESLNEKEISPNEAKAVVGILEKAVDESNEKNMKSYMENSKFHGSPPENQRTP